MVVAVAVLGTHVFMLQTPRLELATALWIGIASPHGPFARPPSLVLLHGFLRMLVRILKPLLPIA